MLDLIRTQATYQVHSIYKHTRYRLPLSTVNPTVRGPTRKGGWFFLLFFQLADLVPSVRPMRTHRQVESRTAVEDLPSVSLSPPYGSLLPSPHFHQLHSHQLCDPSFSAALLYDRGVFPLLGTPPPPLPFGNGREIVPSRRSPTMRLSSLARYSM